MLKKSPGLSPEWQESVYRKSLRRCQMSEGTLWIWLAHWYTFLLNLVDTEPYTEVLGLISQGTRLQCGSQEALVCKGSDWTTISQAWVKSQGLWVFFVFFSYFLAASWGSQFSVAPRMCTWSPGYNESWHGEVSEEAGNVVWSLVSPYLCASTLCQQLC